MVIELFDVHTFKSIHTDSNTFEDFEIGKSGFEGDFLSAKRPSTGARLRWDPRWACQGVRFKLTSCDPLWCNVICWRKGCLCFKHGDVLTSCNVKHPFHGLSVLFMANNVNNRVDNNRTWLNYLKKHSGQCVRLGGLWVDLRFDKFELLPHIPLIVFILRGKG